MTFWNFLVQQVSGCEEDPFAEEEAGREGRFGELLDWTNYPELSWYRDEELYDVEGFLKKNGVMFREGDYAVYGAKRSMLFVKATELSLELIDGIVFARMGSHFPRLIRANFTQVKADEKVDEELLEAEKFSLVRKVGGMVLPGQEGEVRLGEDLALELEAQIDGRYPLVEMRVRLTEDDGDLEKASFQTGFALQEGKPVVVQQVRKNGKWLAWVVTVEVFEVGAGLK